MTPKYDLQSYASGAELQAPSAALDESQQQSLMSLLDLMHQSPEAVFLNLASNIVNMKSQITSLQARVANLERQMIHHEHVNGKIMWPVGHPSTFHKTESSEADHRTFNEQLLTMMLVGSTDIAYALEQLQNLWNEANDVDDDAVDDTEDPEGPEDF